MAWEGWRGGHTLPPVQTKIPSRQLDFRCFCAKDGLVRPFVSKEIERDSWAWHEMKRAFYFVTRTCKKLDADWSRREGRSRLEETRGTGRNKVKC